MKVSQAAAGIPRAGWVALLGAMLLVAVLFARPVDDSLGQPRLSTFSAQRSGARGLYETAARLGWRAVRNLDADLPPDDGATVYAFLAPNQPLTALEVSTLLERVRAGAGLLTVAETRTPLADSLGLRRARTLGRVAEDTAADCPADRRTRVAEALRGTVFAANLEMDPHDRREAVHRAPPDWTGFLELARPSSPRDPPVAGSAIIGFTLGRGRVALVSDPILLTNEVVRRCRLPAGVATMEALAYVSAHMSGVQGRARVLFDEYHHGYGKQPSMVRVTVRFAREHPLGRTLAHASLAGVLIVTALAFRPVGPAPPRPRSRRSSLEHVRALALAYSQVPATRTGTRLLVRGLRRRLHRLGAPVRSAVSDDQFLQELADRFPAVREEVGIVRHALTTRLATRDFVRVGRSIRAIERSISGNQ